ncbi:MAG TPA: hypothetical protein VGN52_07505 [Burkholderiales bacterium]|jgi:hypothetical protein
MTSNIAASDNRVARFGQLYREVLKTDFSEEEFAVNVLYAFQVLDAASRSSSEALRNLAAHLQVGLEMGVETINIRPIEGDGALTITRKMQTLADGSAALAPSPEERRQATTVLTPEMAKMIERLLRFYRSEFGAAFDLEEFLSNDLYGRAVLKKARASANPELLATVEFFFDEDGRPRRHRRRGERDRRVAPPP